MGSPFLCNNSANIFVPSDTPCWVDVQTPIHTQNKYILLTAMNRHQEMDTRLIRSYARINQSVKESVMTLNKVAVISTGL